MAGHGPDNASYDRVVASGLARETLEDIMAYMFESRRVQRLTRLGIESPLMQLDYDHCWSGSAKAELPR